MDIIFGRHGNTFGPGDKVVWVGRETDLALVDKGWQQAYAFGGALVRLDLLPSRIYCATLKRTRGFAEGVVKMLANLPRQYIDGRLDEIHYGQWAGLTAEEISASPEGRQALENWNASDIWPSHAGWVSQEAEIKGAIQQFVNEVILTAEDQDRILVISSNGVLRFFPRALAVAGLDVSSYVMKTGHMGLISGRPGDFRLRFWNAAVETLNQGILGKA